MRRKNKFRVSQKSVKSNSSFLLLSSLLKTASLARAPSLEKEREREIANTRFKRECGVLLLSFLFIYSRGIHRKQRKREREEKKFPPFLSFV